MRSENTRVSTMAYDVNTARSYRAARCRYWFNSRKGNEGRKTDSYNSIVDIWGPSTEEALP